MKAQSLNTQVNRPEFLCSSTRHLRQVCATLLLLAVSATVAVPRQMPGNESIHVKEPPQRATDRYRDLYDVVFPRQTSVEAGKEQFVLTLRYWLTTRSPDFQYNLTKYTDGRVKVVAMRIPLPLYSYLDPKYPLDGMADQEFEAAKEVVKRIPVERREIELAPPEAKELLSGFAAASVPQLTDLDLMHFDGTNYDLWLEAGTYQMSYFLGGEALGAQNISNPLIKWMNVTHEVLSRNVWGTGRQILKTGKASRSTRAKRGAGPSSLSPYAGHEE